MYARQHAADHPDQPAIIMATSGETVTYAQYEAGCNRALTCCGPLACSGETTSRS